MNNNNYKKNKNNKNCKFIKWLEEVMWNLELGQGYIERLTSYTSINTTFVSHVKTSWVLIYGLISTKRNSMWGLNVIK